MQLENATVIGRALTSLKTSERPTYSICTLVTRPREYIEMCDSFIRRGFSPDDTEYLHIDNSGDNAFDAFTAYNMFLTEAKSPYIILCHQDVVLLEDGRDKLDEIIATLDDIDPSWGILGNSGPRRDGKLVTRITDPYSTNRSLHGPFPTRVLNLDENFLLVRRQANLALSHNLKGFHMYGPDLCLIAELLGVTAYVVDFHLQHKSGGSKDKSYYDAHSAFRKKYQYAFRSRWLQIPTLCPVFLSGSSAFSLGARVLRRLGFWPSLRDSAALRE